MPEDKTENIYPEDYVLRQDANLPQLAKDVREGLAKIFPTVTFEEFLESNSQEDPIRTESTHIHYEPLLSDMQSLRQKDMRYVPKNTMLAFDFKDGLGIAFWLDDSMIKIDYDGSPRTLSADQIRSLYRIITPYIIKKSEAEKGDN